MAKVKCKCQHCGKEVYRSEYTVGKDASKYKATCLPCRKRRVNEAYACAHMSGWRHKV